MESAPLYRRHGKPIVVRLTVIVVLFLLTVAPAQTTWTKQQAHIAASQPSICWTGGQLIVVANYGAIYTSPDAAAWTAQASQTTRNLHDITWTGSLAVVVGDSGTVLTSSNGVDWISRSSGTLHALRGVAWAGDKLIVVGDSGAILTSADGTNWAPQASGTAQRLFSAAWTGSQFVAVGEGVILTSPNGGLWTPHDSIFSVVNADWRKDVFTLYDVVWTGSRLVAVGSNFAHVTSEDGAYWVREPVGAGDTVVTSSIIWTGVLVVGACNPGVVASPDGIDWGYYRDPAIPWTQGCVAWTGDKFVLISSTGNDIYTAPFDGAAAAAPLRRAGPDNALTLRADNAVLLVHVPDFMNGQPLRISLNTARGKTVMSQTLDASGAGHRFDLSRFSAGVYVFSVRCGGTALSGTLAVTR